MKKQISRYDSLVARYYPAVYSFAARLTDDPREAVAVTRQTFRSVRRQIVAMRDQTSIAATLISAVLRSGLAAV